MKKNNESSNPVVSQIPVPQSDSPLVIDLPDGQKLVVGNLINGTVIEVATWRGTGRPDSRTQRLMLGVSGAPESNIEKVEDIKISQTREEKSWKGKLSQTNIKSQDEDETFPSSQLSSESDIPLQNGSNQDSSHAQGDSHGQSTKRDRTGVAQQKRNRKREKNLWSGLKGFFYALFMLLIRALLPFVNALLPRSKHLSINKNQIKKIKGGK